MPPLIGWHAIHKYVEDIWGIPASSIGAYHKQMLDDGAVLKRLFGKIPGRHIQVFSSGHLVDTWIILRFTRKKEESNPQ